MGNSSSKLLRARRFFYGIPRSIHRLHSRCCITDDNSREQSRVRRFFYGIPRSIHRLHSRCCITDDNSREQSTARRFFCSIPRSIPQFRRHSAYNTLRSANLLQNVIQDYAYEPEKVAIGPQHFREQRLGSYEHFKLKFVLCRLPHRFSRFKEVSESIDPGEIREWCDLRSIQCLATDTGEQLCDEELTLMMARDGLFLLQILRSMSPSREGNARDSNYMSQTPDFDGTRFFRPLLHPLALKRDIMKIKNQIPIFVLQKILDWEVSTYQDMMLQWDGTPSRKPEDQSLPKLFQDLSFQLAEEGDQSLGSILQRAWQSLSPFPYISADVHLELQGNFIKTTKPHLLQVVYQNIIGSKRVRTNDRERRDISLPRAAELTRKSGVKFSAYKGPLDGIRFDSRTYTFYLPIIEMHEGTLTLMKNLLAFEGIMSKNLLAFEETDAHILSTPIHRYVELMCQLIKKDEDVEVLRDNGIVFNHRGTDQDVIDLWYGFHIRWAEGQYEPIDTATTDIRAYTRKHRRMCAELKEKYFSKPWVTIALTGNNTCFNLLTVGKKDDHFINSAHVIDSAQ